MTRYALLVLILAGESFAAPAPPYNSKMAIVGPSATTIAQVTPDGRLKVDASISSSTPMTVTITNTNTGVSPLPPGGIQGAGFSRTLQGMVASQPSGIAGDGWTRTNQGTSPLPPGGIEGVGYTRTNQGASQVGAWLAGQTVDVLGVSKTQTGRDIPGGVGVAAHVLPVGATSSASSYSVTMTAATITPLVPATLLGVSHITIFNDDNAAMFVGGADVAVSGDHKGITIGAGSSYTQDGINGNFTIFGINAGAGSCQVLRW